MDSIMQNAELTVHAVKFATVDAGWSRTTFPYPHHRLYYVTDGEAEMTLKEQTVRLAPGRCYLLPAFRLVRAVCRDTFSHYFVHFHMRARLMHDLFQWYKPHVEVPCDEELTRALFEKMMGCAGANTIDAELSMKGALQLLLAPFFNGVAMERDIHRFQEVLAYIESHLTVPIRLQTLAGLAGLEETYFSRLFTRTFELPPSQYILRKRLELAQTLLVHTSGKVKEIAYQCGFSNEMYFNRVFRSKIGMTPTAYRESARRGTE